jgi:hypothetical protein
MPVYNPPISPDVYAAIWKHQQPGETSVDEILRRVLKVPGSKPPAPPPPSKIGFYDRRNNVTFPEGLEIFRIYKGKSYRAQAIGGVWVREDTGDQYASLNQLSNSLGASENAWDAWFFRDEAGVEKKIDALRPTAEEQAIEADKVLSAAGL